MVNLAFHLFVTGTVTFALCSYDCSRLLLCCRDMVVICFVVFPTLCLQVSNRLGF